MTDDGNRAGAWAEHLAEQIRLTDAALERHWDSTGDPDTLTQEVARAYAALCDGQQWRMQLMARARLLQAHLSDGNRGELTTMAGHVAGLVSELIDIDGVEEVDDFSGDLEEIAETLQEAAEACRGEADRQRRAYRLATAAH